MSRVFLVRLALIVACAAVYWPVAGFDFVEFDDPDYARDNPVIKSGLTYAGIYWAATTGHTNNWCPVTWVSLMIDTDVYRTLRPLLSSVLFYAEYRGTTLCPGGYHLTNLILHAINALLLFQILRSLCGDKWFWSSALAAGLFATHPMHVESVSWITERKDVLSMLFWLLTMRVYIEYVRHGGVRAYVMVMVFLALGLMSKPMLVTLPCVLLLLDFWPLQRRFSRRVLLEKVPLLLLVIATSIVTLRVQLGAGAYQDLPLLPLSERLGHAAVSYGVYIGKLFWPTDLAMLYPNHALVGGKMWSAAQIAGAVGLLMAITAVAILLRRTRPYLIVGWLWFLGTMVPVIGIVQIGMHSVADRYAYIPFVGLYLMMAWILGDAAQKRSLLQKVAAVFSVVFIAALAVQSRHQVGYWRETETLFIRALNVTEGNWLVHNNLAKALGDEGRLDEAMFHVQRAVEINPRSATLRDHLGASLAQQDDLFRAQEEFEKALELDGDFVPSHFNLAIALARRGKPVEALPHFQRAFELSQITPERNSLIRHLIAEGEDDAAVQALNLCKQAAPQLAAEYDRILQLFPASASN